MSLEEVRQEALRYQLPETTFSDRDLMIETILDKLERGTLPEGMPPPTQRSRATSVRSRKGSGQTDLPGPSHQSTAPVPDATAQMGPLDRIATTLGMFMEQQRQMLEEIRALSRREPSVLSDAPQEKEGEEPLRSPAISTSSPAQAVSLLTPQIPEFGGTDEENVQMWAQRVDRVALVHRAPNDVVLLAAFSKLTKLAKQWYELQAGLVLKS